MHHVRYDLPEAQKSLDFILEQVIFGQEIIITRHGIEIARVLPVEGIRPRGTYLMSRPYELHR